MHQQHQPALLPVLLVQQHRTERLASVTACRDSQGCCISEHERVDTDLTISFANCDKTTLRQATASGMQLDKQAEKHHWVSPCSKGFQILFHSSGAHLRRCNTCKKSYAVSYDRSCYRLSPTPLHLTCFHLFHKVDSV